MELIVKGLGGNRFQGGVTDIKGSELVPERDRRGKGERERDGRILFLWGAERGKRVFSFLLAAEKWGPFFASVVRSLRQEV